MKFHVILLKKTISMEILGFIELELGKYITKVFCYFQPRAVIGCGVRLVLPGFACGVHCERLLALPTNPTMAWYFKNLLRNQHIHVPLER